jgi:hypothetical protein
MPLSFAIVDAFLSDNGEALKDKTLLRHERRRILGDLCRNVEDALKAADAKEFEFESL